MRNREGMVIKLDSGRPVPGPANLESGGHERRRGGKLRKQSHNQRRRTFTAEYAKYAETEGCVRTRNFPEIAGISDSVAKARGSYSSRCRESRKLQQPCADCVEAPDGYFRHAPHHFVAKTEILLTV